MKLWQIRLTAVVLFALGAGASMVYWNWLSLLAYVGSGLCCVYLISKQFQGKGPVKPA